MRVARYVTGAKSGIGYGWKRTSDGDKLPFAPMINMEELCGCRTDISGRSDLPVIELMADNGKIDRWVITQSQYVTYRIGANGNKSNVPAYKFAQSFFYEGASRRSEALCMPQAIAEKCLSVAEYQMVSEQQAPFPAVEISLNAPERRTIGSYSNMAETIFVLRIWKNSWARYRGKRFTPIRMVLLQPDQIERTLEEGLRFTADALNRMLPDGVKGILSVAIAVPQQYAGGFSRDVLHILYNEQGMENQSFDYCGGQMKANGDDNRNELEQLVSELIYRGKWPAYYEKMLGRTEKAEARASYDLLMALTRFEKEEWITRESVQAAWKALGECAVDAEDIEEILCGAEICLANKLDCGGDQKLAEFAVSRFLTAKREDVAEAYLEAAFRGIGAEETLRIMLAGEASDRMWEGFSKLAQKLPHPMEIEQLERLAGYADKHMKQEGVKSFFEKAFDAYVDWLVKKGFSVKDFERFMKVVDKRDERTDNVQKLLAACQADMPIELIRATADKLKNHEKFWQAVKEHIDRMQMVSSRECAGWIEYIQKEEYAEFLIERMSKGAIEEGDLDAFLEYIEARLGGNKQREAIICYYNSMEDRTDAVHKRAVTAVRQMIAENAGADAKARNEELYRASLAELFTENLENAQSLDAINGLIAQKPYLDDAAYQDAFANGAPECCTAPEYLYRLIGVERTFEKAEKLFDDLGKCTSYPVLSASMKAALSELVSGEYCEKAVEPLLRSASGARKAVETLEHYQNKFGLKKTEQVKRCKEAAAWAGVLLCGDVGKMHESHGQREWARLISKPEALLESIDEDEAFYVAAALLAEVSENGFFNEYMRLIRRVRGEDLSEESVIVYTGRNVLKGEFQGRLFRSFCESAKKGTAWKKLERELNNRLKGKGLQGWLQENK